MQDWSTDSIAQWPSAPAAPPSMYVFPPVSISSSIRKHEVPRRVSDPFVTTRMDTSNNGHARSFSEYHDTRHVDSWSTRETSLSSDHQAFPVAAIPRRPPPQPVTTSSSRTMYTSSNPYPRKASGADLPRRVGNGGRPRPAPLSITQPAFPQHRRFSSSSSTGSTLAMGCATESVAYGHNHYVYAPGSFEGVPPPPEVLPLISMHSPSTLSGPRSTLFAMPTLQSPRRSSDSILNSRSPPSESMSAFFVGQGPDCVRPDPVEASKSSCIFYRDMYEARGSPDFGQPSGQPGSKSASGLAKSKKDKAPQDRKEEVLARNRAIASRSRARRRERLEQLETHTSQLGLDNEQLQSDAWALRGELLQLREIVQALNGDCCAGRSVFDEVTANETDRAWYAAEGAGALAKVYTGDSYSPLGTE